MGVQLYCLLDQKLGDGKIFNLRVQGGGTQCENTSKSTWLL